LRPGFCDFCVRSIKVSPSHYEIGEKVELRTTDAVARRAPKDVA
jgi:hypothetical protein